MNNNNNIKPTDNKYVIINVIIKVVLIALFLLSGLAIAGQNDTSFVKDNKPYKLPPNLKKYLIDKYTNISELSSTLQETPLGPRGYIFIAGNIRPKIQSSNISEEPDTETRARAIAKAFLEEEATLLGITDLGEIRERYIKTETVHDGEQTLIKYSRIINGLPYDNAYVDITVGHDNNILHVSAELVPAPQQLYKAVSNQTLTEEQIKTIIKQDVVTSGKKTNEMTIKHLSKWLGSTAPYVTYTATVDLGTGKGKES